LRKV
jgi:hypothetical protein